VQNISLYLLLTKKRQVFHEEISRTLLLSGKNSLNKMPCNR